MTGQKMLVIDSSVAVKWLHQMNEDLIFQADKILVNAKSNSITLVMPELAKYEIGNVLLFKKLELPILQRLIENFYVLPIRFIPEDLNTAELTDEIAYRNKISYYDASFIALAQKLKSTLITNNPKHQNKKISGSKIIPLKNYR